jgi:hypothetical protein
VDLLAALELLVQCVWKTSDFHTAFRASIDWGALEWHAETA